MDSITRVQYKAVGIILCLLLSILKDRLLWFHVSAHVFEILNTLEFKDRQQNLRTDNIPVYVG